MTWKAIGEWVVIEKTVSSGMGKIVQMSDNQGKVVSCAIKSDIVGKTVIFDKFSRINSESKYVLVKYTDVMAVKE
tara:strand:- start:182 stop:406 length:225 start_codon:yes stop_codon:yes gene_type:complete